MTKREAVLWATVPAAVVLAAVAALLVWATRPGFLPTIQ